MLPVKIMKRFDDILSRRIKEAFNNYNADHLADEGWNAFMKKTGKKRIGIVIPLWAKAASVAVLITGAGIIVYETFFRTVEKTGMDVLVTVEKKQKNEQPDTRDHIIKEEKFKEEQLVMAEPHVEPVLADYINKDERVSAEQGRPDLIKTEKLPALLSGINLISSDEFIDEKDRYMKVSYFEPVSNVYSTTEKKKTGILAGLSGMIARVDNNVSSDPGTSMGVYIDRELTDRISIRPGIAFALQGYNLSGSSALNENKLYSAPVNNASSVSIENNDAQLNFMAFEIPLNFIFTVWERKRSQIYVSAGASTMVYLNQKFDGSFTNTYVFENYNSITGGITYDSNSSVVEVENKYGALSHVDFMGLANLSAGYSVPIGEKNSSILFEPFIKLPVSGLTSLDLHVLYGGMSLKIKFPDQK